MLLFPTALKIEIITDIVISLRIFQESFDIYTSYI